MIRVAKEIALNQMAELAIPVFCRELEYRDGHLRQLATRIVSRIDQTRTGMLSPLDPSEREAEEARFQQAQAEAQMEITVRVLPTLLAHLADSDAKIRRSAAEALGRMGPLAREAVPAAKKALEDVSDQVRWAAAGALKYIR